MELQNAYATFQELDAEIIAIAQEERDPSTLPRIKRFVHNSFPIVADPAHESWDVIKRYGIYLVDKKGIIRTHLPGTKGARPRLDLILSELAAVAKKPVPKTSYASGLVSLKGLKHEQAPKEQIKKAEDVMGLRWMWSHYRVTPGLSFKLAFLPILAEGFHVYANGETEMSPFSLELELPKGLELAAPLRYPSGKILTDDELDTKLRIYEKDIPLAALRLKASEELKPGKYNVVVKVRFQACDENACFPPAEKKFILELEVAEKRRGRRGRSRGVAGWQRW